MQQGDGKAMEVILLGRTGRMWRMVLRQSHGIGAAAIVLLFLAGAGTAGYFLGQRSAGAPFIAESRELHAEITHQMAALTQLKARSQAGIDAVAARMARVDAQINRVNAMGAEIVRLSGIKHSGFNFSTPSGEGGAEPVAEVPWAVPGLNGALNALSGRIWRSEHRLAALEALLLHRKLDAEIVPRGKPVRYGWISSGWGWRTDPFTGKREFHRGIDFAGKRGEKVYAIAAGVVTWAGPRYGFGNLVIVNDGNGYGTYYAHNEKVLVKVGEIVRRGTPLSLLGDTGRSTGPHLHLEIHHDGVAVDPLKYVTRRGRG